MSNAKNPYWQQLACALDEFVQSVYWGDDIKPLQARKSLERGLVEITCFYQHSSNGLLITENGYFITAAHCLEDGVFLPQIKLHDGNRYYVEKVCVRGKRGNGSVDLVIAKAGMPGPCKPIKYKLFQNRKVENANVAALARKDGLVKCQYGLIESESSQRNSLDFCFFSDSTFRLSARDYFIIKYNDAVPGDSGGVIVGKDNDIIGLFSGKASNADFSIGVKFFRALELISIYACNVRKR